MLVIAPLNLILLFFSWKKTTETDTYSKHMRILAIPWVWECSWRAAFPSLYLQRFVVWDTPLNAVIVDRNFACVGELAWTAQIAYAMCHIDKDLTIDRKGHLWLQVSLVFLSNRLFVTYSF